MTDDVLCTHCIKWVKCTPHKNSKVQEPYGFCLAEDLFTYTARNRCKEFTAGECCTEQEWEMAQRGEK